MITPEELDALPESGGFGQREEIRGGQRVVIPVLEKSFVLWQEPDEPHHVYDKFGQAWRVGTANGVRYKQRLRQWDQ